MTTKTISYCLPITIGMLLAAACLTATAQPINWDSVRADYVQKYKPQQQPAWLFPLIFEEGSGQRDTLYLGYDKEAQDLGWPPNDTIFGERNLLIDTSKFNAYWSSIVNDSAFKTIIRLTLNHKFSISFYNGTLPLTIYWDKDAFYSDSLPFADQSPAPRAEGRLRFDLPMRAYADTNENLLCPFDDYILLSDTVQPYGPGGCWKQDTVLFFHENHIQNASIGQLQLKIVPWQGEHLSIREKEKYQDVNLYPNPVDDKLWIHNQSNHKLRYELYNINGQRLKSGTVQAKQKRSISCASVSGGLYIMHLQGNGKSHGYPIIID